MSQQAQPAVGAPAPPVGGALLHVRLGGEWLGAGAFALLAAALAGWVSGALGYASAEATARAAHLGLLVEHADIGAFGWARPPLPSALALPPSALLGLAGQPTAVALPVAALGAALGFVVARRLARWAGFGAAPAVLIATAFAAHPALLLAGATGRGDALYAALLLGACLALLRWIESDGVSALMSAGLAIGVALLLRYSALPAALALGGAFWWIAHERAAATHPRGAQEGERAPVALATLLAYAAAVLFPVGLWVLIAALAGTPPHELLRDAWALSDLAADDSALLAEIRRLDADPLALGRWLGGWALALAPLSVAALGWLALHGLRAGRATSGAAVGVPRSAVGRGHGLAAVWLVLVTIALTELAAMLLGPAQPRPLHLTPLIIVAFVAIAVLERHASGGRPPARYEPRRRRRQAALAAALVLGSLPALPALSALPAWEGAEPLRAVTHREPIEAARTPADARAVVEWIEKHAGPGELLVDPERHAPVLTALVAHHATRLASADEVQRLALLEPDESDKSPLHARYLLTRRPLLGAGHGLVEQLLPGAHALGAPALRVTFEAGEYRIYERR